MKALARLLRKMATLLDGEQIDQTVRNSGAGGLPSQAAQPGGARKEHAHDGAGIRAGTITQDLRFALRQMRKNPGFAATAILMLALGIGASTAIFGFVDAALIQPLPYAQPNRLMDVDESAAVFPRSNLSYEDYQDWKRSNTSFSSLDVYTGTGYLLRIGSVTEPVPAARVSDGFFRTLRVQPMLGRDFRPGEDRPGQPKIAMLNYGTWRKRFGGRRSVLGETVSVSGDPYTIVGVLPRNFAFGMRSNAEFWVPLLDKNGCEQRRSCHNLDGVGRLRDGVTVEAARADLKKIAAQLAIQYPGSNRDQGASVQPLSDFIEGPARPILLTLLAGAGLLLVIACVNVANLLLVRSESRRREIAVRGALGASPWRLLRQFVTEGMFLAFLGCMSGLLVGSGFMLLLKKMIPSSLAEQMTFLGQVGIHTHTAWFAAGVTLMAAALMAITPVLRLSFVRIHEAMGEGGRGTASRFWRRLGANLVVVELTIAVVLLAGAGLLAKSFYHLLHVEMGFDPGHLATVNVMIPEKAYPKPERLVVLYHEMIRRVEALPGVRSAGITSDLPVRCNCDTDWIRIAGKPFHGEHNEVMERDASAQYLSTLRAKLLRGRMFTETDDASHPRVTITNETLARKYFPGEDPVGRMIGNGNLDPQSMRQVVGVIADVREAALSDSDLPAEYFSIDQGPDNDVSLVVRTDGDERMLLQELVKTVRAINPDLGVYGEITMTEQIGETPAALLHRLSAWMVGGFATAALVLSVIGLYGVVAYSVSQRTREIGIRMALGAQRSAVHRLILTEAGWLAAIGIVIGLGCSVAASTGLGSMLFGVRAWDVPTLAGVAIVLGLAALLASFLSARRAAAVNPVEALRAE